MPTVDQIHQGTTTRPATMTSTTDGRDHLISDVPGLRECAAPQPHHCRRHPASPHRIAGTAAAPTLSAYRPKKPRRSANPSYQPQQ